MVGVTVAGEHDRPFELASVTKVLTATAVLVAVEEEIVALDEPAGPPGSTVRHLLAHASGLPFEGSTPVAAPGKRRIYSNAGFELLGEIVAERSGIDFASYLARSRCATARHERHRADRVAGPRRDLDGRRPAWRGR